MRAILCPSCRPSMMLKFLETFRAWPQRQDWRLYVVFQSYTPADLAAVRDANSDLIHKAWCLESRLAPYITRARVYPTMLRDGLKAIANCDDDMEFRGTMTDFNVMAAKVQEPGVGVVSGNWARNEGVEHRAVFQPGRWIKQPLVNMAGGQVARREVIEIVLANPIRDYLFCDIQVALLSYVNGYDNFRCLGSFLIHRIMQKDGLKVLFARAPMAPPPPAWVKLVPTQGTIYEGNNWHMPGSENVTDEAHRLHREHRKH